ncbi:MAG: SdpI family protein [Lachnospiraceae bacterium]|nr:SdpI family protein [Ruminococcus sp.]MCM1276179.1 SdpI family protein [Lachnospiraceae bacterium]
MSNAVINLMYLVGELTTPVILMLVALSVWRSPPKWGDSTGYNTKLSRKSEAAWDYAQLAYGRYATKAFAVTSALTFVVGLIALLLNFGEDAGFAAFIIVTAVQIAVLFAVIVVVERELKQKFDENGKPR